MFIKSKLNTIYKHILWGEKKMKKYIVRGILFAIIGAAIGGGIILLLGFLGVSCVECACG